MNQMNSLGGLGSQPNNTSMGGGMQMNSGMSGTGGLGGFYAGNSDPFAELDQQPGQFGGMHQQSQMTQQPQMPSMQ